MGPVLRDSKTFKAVLDATESRFQNFGVLTETDPDPAIHAEVIAGDHEDAVIH